MQGYVEYLHGLGLAPGTIRMYRPMLARVKTWAAEHGADLDNLKPSEVAALRDEFVESAATLRQVRCALQHYWDYRGLPAGPVKALRVPPKPRPDWRGLSDGDARRLAQVSVGWHPEGTATLIGLFTGLRRSEIAATRWDRFNHDLTSYRVLGKRQVTRTVPVVHSLQSMLRPVRGAYLWVFPGEHRGHVSPNTIWQWIGRVAAEADVTVTPHQLRHTAVNRMYQHAKAEGHGDALRVAQVFAGHRRSDTTEIYVQAIDEREVADVAEAALDWLRPYGVDEATA